MGNKLFGSRYGGTAYQVWVRSADDNQYQLAMTLDHYAADAANTLTDALGIFKREVNMFALQRKYVDARVLYLYCGYTRLARAELSVEKNTLSVCACNEDTLAKWRTATEVLAPTHDGGHEWPLAQKGFDQAFSSPKIDDDGVTLRHVRDGD